MDFMGMPFIPFIIGIFGVFAIHFPFLGNIATGVLTDAIGYRSMAVIPRSSATNNDMSLWCNQCPFRNELVINTSLTLCSGTDS